MLLNPNKMYIRKNNDGDYSIVTFCNNTYVQIGRYFDLDNEYMVNRVQEILSYIKDEAEINNN